MKKLAEQRTYLSGVAALLALMLAAASGHAQFSSGSHTIPQQPSQNNSDPLAESPLNRGSSAVQERMAVQRNDERQKRLIADTAKLLQLATQLKTDVEKTDKFMLSLDVIKRSEEIERLAKEIRERAKQ